MTHSEIKELPDSKAVYKSDVGMQNVTAVREVQTSASQSVIISTMELNESFLLSASNVALVVSLLCLLLTLISIGKESASKARINSKKH